MNGRKKRNTRTILIISLVLLTSLGIGIWFINADPMSLFGVDAVIPSTKATSTFTLIDYNTGEDVSSWVEISVWIPDEDDLPFNDEDPYRIGNFDEDISSVDADDVTIDLRSESMAWLQIDPDYESDFGGYNGVFAAPTVDDFRLLSGGANYDYYVYVYHEPSDVDIVILDKDRGMDYWNVSRAISLLSVQSDDINGTVVMSMPWNSTAGYHAGTTGGDEWNLDEDDLDIIEADVDPITLEWGIEMQWLRDQGNFRTIAPYYDMTDDTLKDYASDLEQITNAFAVRFAFNATLNMTDYFNPTTPGLAADTQVNFTLYEQDYVAEHIDVVYNVNEIFLIFSEPIIFNGVYSFDFRIDLGPNVNCTAVQTGRLVVPQDQNNLGAFTAYSTMRFRNFLGYLT
ncbi:hypothetical protein LCGC14_0770280 [marine sediment metagenome]|uniref:Uncharacterized protein n=1 Tax=marine sediment metagenome TaxID=412755 RepID=A0A0F9T5I9_9ZZZZ